MKPILLASQSNSGSTWFADCIAAANPHLKYFPKEFFNPILNHKHHSTLAEKLGCELFSCVQNLARRLSQDEVDRLVDETWGQEGYTFTKENYLVWNLDRFAKHFQIIGLVRDATFCFPPERISVMHWYDNWFWSLVHNHRLAPKTKRFFMLNACTPHRRAIVGWHLVNARLACMLQNLNAPMLDYESLLTANTAQVARIIADKHMPRGLDGIAIAHEVVCTRQPPPRPTSERRREWADAFKFAEGLTEACGSEQVEILIAP